MVYKAFTIGLAVLLLAGFSGEAHAEIVVFRTGRTMSVAAVRADGDRYLFTLREGGEASIPAHLVERIAPDEVPTSIDLPVPTEIPLPEPPPAGPPPEVLAARPFAGLIAAAAATHGLDVRLVHAVIEAESNYRPRARSPKGAKGLMQLMPATARQYAVRDPYDPRANIEAGVRHLKDLLSRFEVGLALAAYNAGEGTVRQYGGLPPFTETRNYVARILQRVGR